MNKRQLGSRYEDMAAAYLIKRGFSIVDRNYRSRQGEIDIIAREGGYIVFIEVKFRKDGKKGAPEEAVDWKKQEKIRNTARYYLYSHGYGDNTPCRFDVISILGEEIHLIFNAF